MNDIVPELIKSIQKDWHERLDGDEDLTKLDQKIDSGKGDYKDADTVSQKIGGHLSDSLDQHLSSDTLPDGKMHYNISNRVFNDVLKEDHQMVSERCQKVQSTLNEKAGIGIKPIDVEPDQDRIDGIVELSSKADSYDDVKKEVNNAVQTFSQCVADVHARRNFEFQGEAGLGPKIIRKTRGKCCSWCDKLVGEYEYPVENEDVYKRHRHCDCTVEYDPGSGKNKRQNVHTKKWHDINSEEAKRRIENNEDVKELNRKDDLEQYKQYKETLGDDGMNLSFPKFQNLKYNNEKDYLKLQDKVYIHKKIQSGEWGTKINHEKQLPHMESTAEPGKSYLYDTVDPQEIFDKYHGTGTLERDKYDRPRNTEVVYIGKPVGINASDGTEVDSVKIHHSKNRTHIVPKKGDL